MVKLPGEDLGSGNYKIWMKIFTALPYLRLNVIAQQQNIANTKIEVAASTAKVSTLNTKS